jgi:hypothetical protein
MSPLPRQSTGQLPWADDDGDTHEDERRKNQEGDCIQSAERHVHRRNVRHREGPKHACAENPGGPPDGAC